LKYLLNKLQEVRHPITGKKAFAQVYRRTDIYTGEYIQNAPDIVVLPNEGFDVGANFNKLWYFPREEGWSAVHKLHGIFIATGPKIRKGLKIEGVKIYDLAPTIMHIFGLPIPSDIDGRVLKEIFETDSELSKKKPVYVDPIHYEKMNQSE
jgi:predicted AlkP superfamily phosphohydrolase/phosphomutase